MGYSPWSHKESDTTERLTLTKPSLQIRVWTYMDTIQSVTCPVLIPYVLEARYHRELASPGEGTPRYVLYLSPFCEVAQSYPTLCDPVGCSLPGSSVHGILQARVLEWGAIETS